MTPAKLKSGILEKEKVVFFIFPFQTASSYVINYYEFI